VCDCGKKIYARGMCMACYSKAKRAKKNPSYKPYDGTYMKNIGVNCACGEPAYQKGKCEKCYRKEWRAKKRE